MEPADRKRRRLVRALVGAYLISWLATMVFSIFATEYDVSDRISEYSWQVFSAASVINIAIIWISAIGLLFFVAWSRPLFVANVLYSLLYSYVFGGGSGNPIIGVIVTVHTMLAGAILYAIYCESSRILFQRKNGKYGDSLDVD